MKTSFLLYADQIKIFDRLSNDDAGTLIKHIFTYNSNGNEAPNIDDPTLAMAFEAIRMSMDRDIEKYDAIVERNRINGLKGGRPPKEPKQPSGLNGKPKNPVKPKEPKKADSDSDSDSVSDSDNDSEKKPSVLSHFDIFWAIYPKKKNKESARKAFAVIEKSADCPDISVMVDAVKAQKQTKDWKKDGGQFIPHPASWLRAGAWQDETEGNPLNGVVSEKAQRTIENLRDLELT